MSPEAMLEIGTAVRANAWKPGPQRWAQPVGAPRLHPHNIAPTILENQLEELMEILEFATSSGGF